MCGVVGILAQTRVNQMLYDALTIVQHRGQDAAGIMTCDQQRMYLRKSNGLVRDAIREKHMLALKGNMGIGHVRYPTAGTDSVTEAQPFYVNSPYGLGVVHNGNLTNTQALTKELSETDHRHLNTCSDSEVMLNVLAYELQQTSQSCFNPQQLFMAMRMVYARLEGAFSAVAMINGRGLIAFRDAQGIRPLVYGQRQTVTGPEYMVASETIALNVLGFDYVDDIKPGEVIFFAINGQVIRQSCAAMVSDHPCLFEYIYLARPDSVMHRISVYRARQNMGVALAKKIQQLNLHEQIDTVIPVPDTSRSAALSLAQHLGLEYSEGFVKNRYIGRTFIMPEQTERRNNVRLKLNAMREEFEGRSVLLVDDSIVRGTTSREIVQMARDVGAKQVFFASAAPPIRHPNVYGIDMPSARDLIAYERTTDEVASLIGADWLVYQDLQDVVNAVNEAAKSPTDQVERFEDAVFTGDYLTSSVGLEYLSQLSHLRSQKTSGSDHDRLASVYSGDDDVRIQD